MEQQGVASLNPARSSPYSKELRLLQHVLDNAEPGNPASVCEAVERFGEEVLPPDGLWLKVAGGVKAKVLASAIRGAPDQGSILKIGTYCGYSAIRMAMALPNTRIVSMEVEPVHVVIARNIVAFAGLCHTIDVWTGHSKDLLYRLPDRYGGREKFPIRAVFMDQKGSRFDEDLREIEKLGVLVPGAVIVADNVLKPGSPIFLWCLTNSDAWDTQLVRVREFAMAAEDWMSVSVLRREAALRLMEEAKHKAKEEAARKTEAGTPAGAGGSPTEEEGDSPPTGAAGAADCADKRLAEPPEELVQLQWESDRMRAQAIRGAVNFGEWATFAEQMRQRMAPWNIAATVDGTTLDDDAELVPRPASARRRTAAEEAGTDAWEMAGLPQEHRL